MSQQNHQPPIIQSNFGNVSGHHVWICKWLLWRAVAGWGATRFCWQLPLHHMLAHAIRLPRFDANLLRAFYAWERIIAKRKGTERRFLLSGRGHQCCFVRVACVHCKYAHALFSIWEYVLLIFYTRNAIIVPTTRRRLSSTTSSHDARWYKHINGYTQTKYYMFYTNTYCLLCLFENIRTRAQHIT